MAQLELRFVLFTLFSMFVINFLLGMVITDIPEYETTTISNQLNDTLGPILSTILSPITGIIDIMFIILTFGQFSFIGALSILPVWINGLLLILNGLTFVLLVTYFIQVFLP